MIAKAPARTPPATLKLMLKSLLADRFKLVVHPGRQASAGLCPSAGKGKLKLKEAEGSGEAECKDQEPPQKPAPDAMRQIVIDCHHSTMEELARNLQRLGGRLFDLPSGGFHRPERIVMILKSSGHPRNLLQKAGADGISIFDAVDKELGLKLDLETAPRPVLIVDSVNQEPTANVPGLEKILPTPPPPQFDVAVIKPSKSDEESRGKITGGQIDVRNFPLRFLITFAWDLNPNDKEMLVGAPKWLDVGPLRHPSAKVVNDAPDKPLLQLSGNRHGGPATNVTGAAGGALQIESPPGRPAYLCIHVDRREPKAQESRSPEPYALQRRTWPGREGSENRQPGAQQAGLLPEHDHAADRRGAAEDRSRVHLQYSLGCYRDKRFLGLHAEL